jgi:uncharacterized protein
MSMELFSKWIRTYTIDKQMKRSFISAMSDLKPAINLVVAFLLFFLFLFLYTKIAGPIPFSVNSVQTTKSDTFMVSGEGKISAIPDMAVVTVGVQSSAATVQEAQDALNVNINKISAAIKQLGVDPKDIQTTNYTINPRYDERSPVGKTAPAVAPARPGIGVAESTVATNPVNPRISGYDASSHLIIKIRDINNANKVIDSATAAGANQVGGISFDFADKSKLEDEAREKAVAEAKKKASQASRIAGFNLGKIINYNENFGGVMPMAYGSRETMMAKDQAGTTQVEPGSSEVTVYVTLSYELR